MLAQFLDLWRYPHKVRDTLLRSIDSVLAGETEFEDIGADVVGVALVQKQNTELFGSKVGYSDLKLPTADFRDIVLGWLEFLEG